MEKVFKSMTTLIDVHHHILPAHYVEQVGAAKIGAQGSSGRVPEWSVADALRRMDTHGVRAAVTSVTSPGISLSDKQARATLARWCNDFAARLTVDHPGRFGLFATLPMPDVDDVLREIEFAYDECSADGICLLTNYDGLYADDSRFRPIYEELNRRGSVVFVHPTMPPNMAPVGGLSASTLEFTFDTTRAIAGVIFGGVTRDFPRIRFIFSHAGGAMPFLAERIELLTRNNPRLREFIPRGITAELRRMYFDTALSAHRAQFAALMTTVPADNVLFGSDYPFGPPNQVEEAVMGLRGLHLPADALRRIESDNALMLFPRFATAFKESEGRKS